MSESYVTAIRRHPAHDGLPASHVEAASSHIVLSFDVEEHHRIEAAADTAINPELRTHYSERLEPSTRWLLDQLEAAEAKATFFIVGEIARDNPDLVKAIHRAGHEIASHGWDHRRIVAMTPTSFRTDVRQCKDALEQVTGEEVRGYRAPTFSLMRQTAWAVDILVELGYRYDSSIYPVRHDRYGVPEAPRGPFVAHGPEQSILELPPATLRFFGMNAPMGGGGYFRLFPLWLTKWAMRQMRSQTPGVAMLYFHPWEFDVAQRRLPLRRLSAFRTYVGLRRTRARFLRLLENRRFMRAWDVAQNLDPVTSDLPQFLLAIPDESAQPSRGARIPARVPMS